jgi:drug/metabolite transporter (DMT)-like permease
VPSLPTMVVTLLQASMVGTLWFSVSQSVAVRWCNATGRALDANWMVLATELCKIAISCLICWGWLRKPPFLGPVRWGFVVSAMLYAVTNTLTYVILESTDLGVFLVLSQQKILWTVALSKAVLGKAYTARQWWACLLLMLGMAAANRGKVGGGRGDGGDDAAAVSGFALALIAVQAACSALASVWIEKMMKRDAGHDEDPLHTFFTDSVQMYVMGIPFYVAGYALAASKPPGALPPGTLMLGALVLNAACTGLFVGSVFKFYSSVVRCFLQGVSMVLSVLLAWFVLSEPLSPGFVLGATMVVVSVLLFNYRSSGVKAAAAAAGGGGSPSVDHRSAQQGRRVDRHSRLLCGCGASSSPLDPWLLLSPQISTACSRCQPVGPSRASLRRRLASSRQLWCIVLLAGFGSFGYWLAAQEKVEGSVIVPLRAPPRLLPSPPRPPKPPDPPSAIDTIPPIDSLLSPACALW